MILDSIVSVLVAIFTYLLGFFPDVDAQTVDNLHNGLSYFGTYAYQFNWIFPVSELFVLLSILIIFAGTVLLVKLGRWIMSMLTGGIFK